MRSAARWMLILSLLTALMGNAAIIDMPSAEAAAPRLQSVELTMTAPTGCPFAGCAAGQRLNMKVEYEPTKYAASLSPNIKICLWTPSSWNVSPQSVTVDPTGEVSGKPYTVPTAGGCVGETDPPFDQTLVGEREATLASGSFADALGFGFRISTNASGKGRVVVRVFAQGSSGWVPIGQSTSSTLEIVGPEARAFVANDPATCSTARPCYVNSGEDLPGGAGTGLKDAVDAAPDANSVVTILSSYTIKSQTVNIDKPLTLNGREDARITYSGPSTCSPLPMLSLNSAVTLEDLTVSDGACDNPSRPLVQVNSGSPVTIRENDLTGGADAISILKHVEANADDRITIRANAINGNSGYAVRAAAGAAPIEITGNNLQGNHSGPAVECSEGSTEAAANRKANHNYWGDGAPGQAETHCIIEAPKRLGMPAALEPNKAGLRVRLVNVTGSKVYNQEFDRQIAYRHTGDGSFDLFIVDHGYASAGGPPFSLQQGGESPSPCSNAWDVFLPDGGAVSGNLELSFKYDRTNECQTTISSNQYCGQTADPAKYPLYWLDPRAASPAWMTTGSKIDANTSGQNTTCNITDKEITVAIDNSGRPHVDDLRFVPMMVGVPIIQYFAPLADLRTITVTWRTNNEPDVRGFYVLRGNTPDSLSVITGLLPNMGNYLTGYANYRYVDGNLENNVNYYYRLQVVRADGTSIYSKIVGNAARLATITPTFTIGPTFTLRPSATPMPTLVSTSFPTRFNTATQRSVFGASTLTTTTPALVLRTNTPTLNMTLPGARFTATALARTNAAFRPSPSPSAGTFSPDQGYPPPGGTADGTPSPTLGMTEAAEATITAAQGETATADLLTQTAAPSITITLTPSPAVENEDASAPGGQNQWLSLLLGMLAGLAAAGGLAGVWYFLRLKH